MWNLNWTVFGSSFQDTEAEIEEEVDLLMSRYVVLLTHVCILQVKLQ